MIRYLPFVALIFMVACGTGGITAPSEAPPSTNDTDTDAVYQDESPDPSVVNFGDIILRDGTIGGMLDNETWSGAITHFRVHAYANETAFEMIMENDQGAAMIWTSLGIPLDNPAFEPGNRFELVPGSDDNAFEVYVLSCSGTAARSWDYDVESSSVVIETEGTHENTLVTIDAVGISYSDSIYDTMSAQFMIERVE